MTDRQRHAQELRVGDVMRHGVITCHAGASLGAVAELMVQHRIHAVFVEAGDGRPVGVLSDIDLLSGEWLSADPASFQTMRAMTAGELMTAPPATIAPDATAAEAAARLQSERISRLLVVEGSTAVGVVSVGDLVQSLVRPPTSRRRVADVMSHAFVVAPAGARVGDLARAMTERRSRSVVILHRDGRIAGVVTGRSLLRFVRGGEQPREPTAEEVMEPPQTIAPHATLQEAADRMLLDEVHRLVVVTPEADVPVGVVSTADIAVEMAAPGSPWRG